MFLPQPVQTCRLQFSVGYSGGRHICPATRHIRVQHHAFRLLSLTAQRPSDVSPTSSLKDLRLDPLPGGPTASLAAKPVFHFFMFLP